MRYTGNKLPAYIMALQFESVNKRNLKKILMYYVPDVGAAALELYSERLFPN